MNTTETSIAGGADQAAPVTIRLGPAHLIVTDLDRSIEFYERSIGLQVRDRDAATAVLWAGGAGDLLVLEAEPGARPAGRHAGLYHVALLHPSRVELARAAARLAETRTRILGASDHDISEAIYLHDPDGNEIELAADRPREAWPDLANPGWDGGPKPLDLHGLLDLVAGEPVQEHADPGLTVGHVHLHIGDVERGLRVLPRRARVRRDDPAADRRVPGDGRVPPPRRDQCLARRRRPGRAGGDDRPAALDDRLRDAAGSRRGACPLEAAGIPTERRDDGVLVRDPWDIALLLTARDRT